MNRPYRWATIHGKRIKVVTLETGEPVRKPRTNKLFGCPLWWLKLVLPLVQSKEQLVVAIYLWRRRVICDHAKTFKVSNTELNELGIDRRIKYRTLEHLEAAKIIAVEWPGKEAGKSLVVTILARP
jgi:hypothetical protein